MLSSSTRLASLRRLRFIRYQSTSVETKDTNEKTDIRQATDVNWDKIKTVFARQPKKPARPPLMKNLFAAKIDSELIAFPEVVNREDMATLYKTVDESKEFFRTVDSKGINKAGMIPSDVVDGLRNLDAFGTDVPRNLGGKEYLVTESCLRNESEAEDVNVIRTLNAHRLVTQILTETGSEAQKQKYLPLLAKGTYTTTHCVVVSISFDRFLFQVISSVRSQSSSLNWHRMAFSIQQQWRHSGVVIGRWMARNRLSSMEKMRTCFWCWPERKYWTNWAIKWIRWRRFWSKMIWLALTLRNRRVRWDATECNSVKWHSTMLN